MEINKYNFIKAIKIRPYFIRECSICDYPLTYNYIGDQLHLDSGCDCVNYINNSPRAENDLDWELKHNIEKVTKFINIVLGDKE